MLHHPKHLRKKEKPQNSVSFLKIPLWIWFTNLIIACCGGQALLHLVVKKVFCEHQAENIGHATSILLICQLSWGLMQYIVLRSIWKRRVQLFQEDASRKKSEIKIFCDYVIIVVILHLIRVFFFNQVTKFMGPLEYFGSFSYVLLCAILVDLTGRVPVTLLYKSHLCIFKLWAAPPLKSAVNFVLDKPDFARPRILYALLFSTSESAFLTALIWKIFMHPSFFEVAVLMLAWLTIISYEKFLFLEGYMVDYQKHLREIQASSAAVSG